MVDNHNVRIINALTKEECRKIIELAGNLKFKVATIFSEKSSKDAARDYRSAEVTSLSVDHNEITNKLIVSIIKEVESFYRTPISNYCTSFQLIRYGVGDFYKVHRDVYKKNIHPKRVLSVIVFLSDQNDYEGGHVRFYNNDGKSFRIDQKPGTVVIFPSDMKHEVTTVTNGTRFVLVTWLKDFPLQEESINEPV
jgi:PKHD-type hydroxylase